MSMGVLGMVRLKHAGKEQDGTVVVEIERRVMFFKKSNV